MLGESLYNGFMSAIIIAPTGNLPFLPEEIENLLVALQKNFKVTLLQTEVTETKLAREFNLGKTYSLVWVASHTSETGIQLTGDEVISVANFSRWLLNVECRVLVLNSCFSAQLVAEIQNYANVEVVATIRPEGIKDKDATINASFLATNLVKTDSVQLAVQRATGNGATQYCYFPKPRDDTQAKDMATVLDLLHKQEMMIRRLQDKMNVLEDKVDPITRVIRGDPDLNVPPLMDQIRVLRAEQENKAIIQVNITQVTLLLFLISAFVIGLILALRFL